MLDDLDRLRIGPPRIEPPPRPADFAQLLVDARRGFRIEAPRRVLLAKAFGYLLVTLAQFLVTWGLLACILAAAVAVVIWLV